MTRPTLHEQLLALVRYLADVFRLVSRYLLDGILEPAPRWGRP